MPWNELLIGVMLSLAVVGAFGTNGKAPAYGDSSLRLELETITQRAIFFSHQSVGMNILDGLKTLAAQEGIPLRVIESSGTLTGMSEALVHGFVAENHNPELKLQNFARAMNSLPPSTRLDIAFLKFCYVDFGPNTDTSGLFVKYQATITELKAKQPGTVFVHVTVPLTTVQGGVKALVKRFLGRAPAGFVENTRREEYNALLRQAYQAREPLFDLAAVESTLSDGRQVAVDWKGRSVPGLAAEYSSDGGHLNRTGQRRVARELVRVLSSIPLREPVREPAATNSNSK